jgi:predicted membrane-bound dolichyl-phosphate-mannose-protein mannosyltransferase
MIVIIFAIFLLAFLLRLRAAVMSSPDYDEPIYLGDSKDVAGFVRNLDLGGFMAYNKDLGHPFFGKFLFALSLIARDSLFSARLISVILGSLTVLLIARRTPVGGFFLATELITIKYSSEAYFDVGAVFFALVSIFLYERSKKKEFWLYFSAVAGGLAFATKYTTVWIFQIIPIMILIDTKTWKLRIKKILIWAVIAAAVFMLVNPPFWTDSKLYSSITSHAEFAGQETLRLPWYHHFSLMWDSMPLTWNPGVFLIDVDKIMLILGFLGFPLMLYKKRTIESLWFVFALGFLLAWPIKWTQYITVFTPALAMSAGFLVEDAARAGLRSTRIDLKRFRAGFSNAFRKLRVNMIS